MKKNTVFILILSSLLLIGVRAEAGPAPLLAEFCERTLGTDSGLTVRCVNSQASSELIQRCEYYPKRFYSDVRTDEMFLSCLEANITHAFYCGTLAWSYSERGECLKIMKSSEVTRETVSACNDFPKGKEMECLKTATKLNLNVEACKGWATDKKMECLEILKAQKQQ